MESSNNRKFVRNPKALSAIGRRPRAVIPLINPPTKIKRAGKNAAIIGVPPVSSVIAK